MYIANICISKVYFLYNYAQCIYKYRKYEKYTKIISTIN